MDRDVQPKLIAPVALAVLLVAVLGVAAASLGGGGGDDGAKAAETTQERKLPFYWEVKRGDTLGLVADKTGLSVERLEQLNPRTDPNNLLPGTRLELRTDIPRPKAASKGPKWYRVKPGDSYGSIAAKFDRSIITLQELNSKISPKKIAPGDRIQLRE